MLVQRLIAKLTVKVTDANREYDGSITIDRKMMALVDFKEYDMVHVNCLDTGKHWETYVIPGDDGEVCLNGAAANHFNIGDRVHILLYGITDREIVYPKIVKLI